MSVMWRCTYVLAVDRIPCSRMLMSVEKPECPCSAGHLNYWERVESPQANDAPDAGARIDAPSSNASAVNIARRERLPDERASVTRTFRLAYQHRDGSMDVMRFYFIAGLYEDGRVGEVFVKADKTGTLASGALDATAIMMSMLLQHGVPLEELVSKFKGMRFPPSGFTKDPDIQSCTSPLDLLVRWLEFAFIRKGEP